MPETTPPTPAADLPDHLWPCGCLENRAGAHRGACPTYERIWEPGGWLWVGRRTTEEESKDA